MNRTLREGLPLSSDPTMIFAVAPGPGASKKPLPRAVAVVFLLLSPVLAYAAYDIAFVPPPRNDMTCIRTSETAIVCQPGDLKGARAELQQTGKHSKDCFTVAGDSRWQCVDAPGVAASAVERVNALSVGASVKLDLTDYKNKAVAGVPLFFAITMLIGAVIRLRSK